TEYASLDAAANSCELRLLRRGFVIVALFEAIRSYGASACETLRKCSRLAFRIGGRTSIANRRSTDRSYQMESAHPNIARYPTLHRYFLHAHENRRLFLAETQGEHPYGPRARLHLELWYACLVPVLEGWRKEKIKNAAVTAFMRHHRKIKLLIKCRNVAFHYSPHYFDERTMELMTEEGIVTWVHGLHDAISAFFLAEDA